MWDCEAYGRELTARGVLCFVADRGQRVCGSQAECRKAMAAARSRLFTRTNERAVDGDQVASYLAETFARPDQLLGGGGEVDLDDGDTA
ncbi:hypothetical protein ACWDSJ_27765 [Nocardia sp. NPDC003482]